MKKIIYLSYYFEPDLSAGSFRNTSLISDLSKQAKEKNISIDLYTTMPNRYSSYRIKTQAHEVFENLRIHRINVLRFNSSLIGQVLSFSIYYFRVIALNRNNKFDLVIASSSRLFTALLGYRLACRNSIPLVLDIRDIFVDTMNSILNKKISKMIIPLLYHLEYRIFSYAKHINLVSPGFKDYFEDYDLRASFSYFTNGIDESFLLNRDEEKQPIDDERIVITYAGNIGDGQGLEKIIPITASLLGDNYRFVIYGDGGAKSRLISELDKLGVTNVDLFPPISRSELIKIYESSDFLFLHLNNYKAFDRVLPSKIFELATVNKIILAGVSGFASRFVKSEVSHSFVFDPGDYQALVEYLKNGRSMIEINRTEFIHKYRRSVINHQFSELILRHT